LESIVKIIDYCCHRKIDRLVSALYGLAVEGIAEVEGKA